jgi:hypothetical protein
MIIYVENSVVFILHLDKFKYRIYCKEEISIRTETQNFIATLHR